MAREIHLPDTLATWKWPRHLNLHYAEARQESSDWVTSFHAFGPRAQRAFDKCNFGLLASLAYPLLTKEHLRVGCDLMNLFFVIDEHTDVAGATEVRNQVSTIMDALRHPCKPRPCSEWIGGEIARQFWNRATQFGSVSWQKRFLQTFEEYLNAVVTQAVDRSTEDIRDLDSYFILRQDTIGAKPSYTILDLGMDLPDKIHEHPILQELESLCTRMLCIGNDLVSYNKEQACGDDEHNLVTIAMHQLHTDVQGSLNWALDVHKQLEDRFNQLVTMLPSWGHAHDADVKTYVGGLGNWVRANDEWSFDSQRYFGVAGHEVKASRKLALSPMKRVKDVTSHIAE